MNEFLKEAKRIGFEARKTFKEEKENPLEKSIFHFSSNELISLLNLLINDQSDSFHFQLQIDQKERFQYFFSFLNNNQLEEKIELLKEMTLDLQQIMEQKATVASKLQQPYSGDFIVIDPIVQKDFHDAMKIMSIQIQNLSKDLKTIQWAQSADVLPDLEKVSAQISAFAARYQRFREALVGMSLSLHKLVNLDKGLI
eukprot:TRINITY_DN2612_c0_g1_i6.p2 TRINITY_DN2612_c0_g1~~TRINITY_DN2612_c0_g1_i6.p2  ORF type:complete len:198 (+),score=77.96 TRINITY_DN2612_c0_g1_i6:296-889(+)